METIVKVDRRQFLKAGAAVGGGLALEFSVPGVASAQRAAAAPTEVTHWIVIKPNDEALVKLTAYDYALYGGLDGVVTLISPDTLQDNRRPSELKLNHDESYYRVIVKTSSNQLVDKAGKPLPIIPGMVATVDIKTGEKTVFEYLVKPITRLKQALRER